MKKLILCLSLTLLTSISLCQSSTKTVSEPTRSSSVFAGVQDPDSLMLFPVQIVRYMVQDVVRGREIGKISAQQDSIIQDKNKEIALKDSVNRVLASKYNRCVITNGEWENIDTVNQKTIQSLNGGIRKYKRQRNAFKIFLGVALLGLAIK